MIADRADYFRNNDDWYTRSPPTWQSRPSQARSLRTDLTDDEIKDCGLLVLTKVDVGNLLDRRFDADAGTGPAEEWLVRGAANDEAPEHRTEHAWHAVVLRRLDELREIALEEGLDLDETSADAALAFLERLPSVRQPGTFLVGGNIRLVWDTASGEQIGQQFRGSNKIQFVIFQFEDGELGSVMGVKSSDAVLRMLLASDIRAILTR